MNLCSSVLPDMPLSSLRALRKTFFPADAQKFKTKFEECRKEIEEREKKGNVVLVGGVPPCRLTLYPAAVPGGCFFRLPQKFLGCCDYLDLSRVMQLPRDIGCFLGSELAIQAPSVCSLA